MACRLISKFFLLIDLQTLKENFDIDNFVLWVERVQNLKEDVKKNLQ